MYDKQFFRILRQRYEDINSLLLITSRKKIIVATYVKLQEAYAAEQNAIGSWANIGYKDPSGSSTGGNTTNFAYSEGETKNTEAWKATSRVGLNDCQTNTVWMMGATYASSTGNITFTPGFTPNGNGCTMAGLTPNFDKIGAASAGN